MADDLPFGYPSDIGSMLPEGYGAGAPVRDLLAKLPMDAIKSMVSTVAGPGQLSQPNPYAPGSEEESWFEDQRQKGALNWGREAAMNLAGIGAPVAETGAAGIFGGRLSQTADLNALQRAEKMHAAGEGRDAIWDQTGWFKGADDKWRYEIPDTNARMHPTYETAMPNGRFGPIAGEVWHPELYQAYPDLRTMTAFVEKSPSSRGSYSMPGATRSGDETINLQVPNAEQGRSVALHELQHAVQEREGFSSGGNPAMFTQADDAKLSRDALSWRKEMARFPGTAHEQDLAAAADYHNMGATDWMPSKEAREVAKYPQDNPDATLQKLVELYGLDKQTTPYTPRDLYRSVPGEVEARNVQTRRDFTPDQRRQMRPWESLHWMDNAAASPVLSRMFGGRVGLLEGP